MFKSLRKIRFTPYDLALALFLLSAGLGVLPAYDRSLAWAPLAVMLAGGCLYVALSRGARREWFLRIARVVVIGSGLLGLFFITQVAHYQPADKIQSIARLAEWIGRLFPAVSFWQPFPNSMAAFLEGMLFLSIGLLMCEQVKAWRIAAAVSAGVILLALLLSMSRGAWLAVGFAGLVWLAYYWRAARWGLALIGMGIAALVLFVIISRDIQALDRIPLVNRTLAPLFIRPDRLDVYRGSMTLIEDMPFTGIGLGGQFAMQYSRYVLMIQVPFLTYSHNLYLEVWLEQGIVGFLSLVWLGIAVVWASIRQLRHGHDPLFEGTTIGLAAFYLHGLTDARPYVDLWCWLPFFLLLGLNASVLLKQPGEAKARNFVWVWTGALISLAVVFLLTSPYSMSLMTANLACLDQSKAELAPSLTETQRMDFLRRARFRFTQSINARPNQRTAHLRMGMLLGDEERFQEAAGEVANAYAADPSNRTVVKALGLAYVRTSQLARAAELLRDVDGIVEELNTWGWWWNSRGNLAQAWNAYQASLLLNPDQPDIRQALEVLPPF